MFFRTKIAEIPKKYVFVKNVNQSSFFKILLATSLITFFDIGSIEAQIKNDLYGQQSGDFAGVSSLMLAVSSNDIDGVKFFSRAGGFLINQKNIGGATALHIAARNGNIEIINLLLANGAAVNVVDNEGWTPLMRASMAGHDQVVSALLDKGADASIVNYSGKSALVQATLFDCDKCLNLIFTKSNLIRKMDTRLLKEQLIDAFIISRNRENKVTQNLLEGYLDLAIKMTPLVVDNSKPAHYTPYFAEEESQPQQEFFGQNDLGGRVKYVLIEDDLKDSISKPNISPKSPKIFDIQENVVAEPPISAIKHVYVAPAASQPVEPIMPSGPLKMLPNSSKPAIVSPLNVAEELRVRLVPQIVAPREIQPQIKYTPKPVTKFKFISGVPGVENINISVLEPQKQSPKMVLKVGAGAIDEDINHSDSKYKLNAGAKKLRPKFRRVNLRKNKPAPTEVVAPTISQDKFVKLQETFKETDKEVNPSSESIQKEVLEEGVALELAPFNKN